MRWEWWCHPRRGRSELGIHAARPLRGLRQSHRTNAGTTNRTRYPGFSARSSADEVEAEPGDVSAHGVDQDLATDPIEVVAASDNVEPAVVPPDVAADGDVAEAAVLTIEMRD